MRALDGDGTPEARRFSPLNAPQRAAVEAFCNEAAGWARRQARRTYGHLNDETRQQAIDRAMREVRLGAPAAVDRRTLYEALADELTHQLRQVHAGWCLNAAQGQWRQEGPVAVPAEEDARAAAYAVGEFVDTGLGGLERAVLQLEIGAGRDTRTSRAALRLGAREYTRHREEGLSKLRSAIAAHERGRVCENHSDAVVLAATGDAQALAALSSGADRCRACAREASGLRRVLQERLAVAPWPLAIKPAGVLAAKAGFLGAVFGGKAAGTGGLTAATSGPLGTGGALAIIATAAIATGMATMVDDEPVRETRVTAPAARVPAPAATLSAPTRRATTATSAKKSKPKAHTKARANRRSASLPPAARQTAPATTRAPQSGSTAPATAPADHGGTVTVPPVQDTVDKTLGTVRDTVNPVTDALPAPVQPPVDQTLDTVQNTVDDVTGAVDGVLP